MADVVKKQINAESKDKMRLLHEKFSQRVAASGLTPKEIEEAARKARDDVREPRRSD